jgi:hypothetical protein
MYGRVDRGGSREGKKSLRKNKIAINEKIKNYDKQQAAPERPSKSPLGPLHFFLPSKWIDSSPENFFLVFLLTFLSEVSFELSFFVPGAFWVFCRKQPKRPKLENLSARLKHSPLLISMENHHFKQLLYHRSALNLIPTRAQCFFNFLMQHEEQTF